MMRDKEFYMSLAVDEARKAGKAGDVPVGCVIADGDGNVIAAGHNRREANSDATAHAELEAIREASRTIGDWRLDSCTMYVTLEPCPMCAGGIIMSRMGTVVYGAKDKLTGSCGSVIDLFYENYGHRPKVYSGVLADECAALLKDFFKDKR